MKKYSVWVIWVWMTTGFGLLWAQDSDVLLNDEAYYLLERLDIQQRTDKPIPLDFKPLGREQVAEFLREADQTGMGKRATDLMERVRMQVDDDYAADYPRGILRAFYRNRRDFLHYKTPQFRAYLNPVLHFSGGIDQFSTPASGSTSDSRFAYRNSRGAAIHGSIANKIGFYGDFFDTQARFPTFATQAANGQQNLWGEAFIKPFGNGGFDFLNSRGYLTYSPIPQIRLKFGRDRAFLGQGNQSLFLSDNATDHLMLNIALRFGKWEYINHFTQFIDLIPNKPDVWGAHPRKWGTFHLLTFRPIRQLSIGLFESTIYASTQPNGSRGFEMQYLNPLIMYRAIEQFVGSPDNSQIGLQFRGNFLKRFQVYGQFLIDDYNFGEGGIGGDYFGNKIGMQAGGKYIDVLGIESLDLQLEYNRVRPYTYSHFNTGANYSHYGQYLAHGWGSNLHDFTVIARYRILPRLQATVSFTYLNKGLDPEGRNNGGDIFLSHNTRNNGQPNPDFSARFLQGSPLDLKSFYAKLTYQLFDLYCYIDAELWIRSDNTLTNNAFVTSVRFNLPHKPARF